MTSMPLALWQNPLSFAAHLYAQQIIMAVLSFLMTPFVFFFQTSSDEHCFHGKWGTLGLEMPFYTTYCVSASLRYLHWDDGFMNWSLYMVLVFVDIFVWNTKGSLAFFTGNQIALPKTVFYYSSLSPRSVCTLNSLCWVQHIMHVFRFGKSVCA